MLLAPTFVAGATALDTPTLVLDLDAFDSNVREFLPRHGAVKVRPHLKSAKSVEAAQRVMAAGAAGICVAKLSEAEIMLAGGLPDVLITTEIVSARKAERLAAAVLRHPTQRLATVVDSPEGAEILDRALTGAGAAVEVLIDVDVGQGRCGVTPSDAPALAHKIATCPSLRLVGVQGYEGHLQHVRRHAERRSRCAEAMAHLSEAVGALARSGYSVETVTTGGTGTSTFCARHEVVTEVQPGSFMFLDGDYLANEGVEGRASLFVVASVLRQRDTSQVIVDAGLKALSNDSGPAQVVWPDGWAYAPAGDEHGVMTARRRGGTLSVGDPVLLLPSHCDTTINLYDEMHVIGSDGPPADWSISARGALR